MASKIKVDTLETANGSGTIALSNQLSGMTTASLPALGSAQMPSGSVLQVQYMYSGLAISSTSQTYSDTGINVSITPTSTSSKILVFAHIGGTYKSANVNAYMALQIVRGSTPIHIFEGQGGYNATNQPNGFGTEAGVKLDSPATNSAINYKIQIKNLGGVGTVYANQSGALSSITLMEIQG